MNRTQSQFHILFRESLADEGEGEALSSHPYWNQRSGPVRTLIPFNSTIIGRYSVLPYYKEFCDDCSALASVPVNSLIQHCWISNFSYYYDIEEHTFPSFMNTNDYFMSGYDGPVVVKGRTNSMKMQWNTHMFANNKQEAGKVINRLYGNPFIEPQGLIVRKYIPLKKLAVGFNDLPITEEYRLFYYKDKMIAGGFYWATLYSKMEWMTVPTAGIDFANTIAEIAKEHTNFFVIDIARKEDGNWICVEINDGQMSGLSSISPTEFYSSLHRILIDK